MRVAAAQEGLEVLSPAVQLSSVPSHRASALLCCHIEPDDPGAVPHQWFCRESSGWLSPSPPGQRTDLHSRETSTKKHCQRLGEKQGEHQLCTCSDLVLPFAFANEEFWRQDAGLGGP